MRRTRLSFKEKMDLCSGAVYIFSQGDTGICRWTDGKFWTPSRFQDGFLVYWELETTPCDAANGRPLSAQSTDTIATKNQKRYRIKQGGLIKKAISIDTPHYGALQLVSYFTELGKPSHRLLTPRREPRPPADPVQLCHLTRLARPAYAKLALCLPPSINYQINQPSANPAAIRLPAHSKGVFDLQFIYTF